MTQVEFYSLTTDEQANGKGAGQGTPYSHLCEVIKRAYRKGQKVFVNTESRQQAEKIDELLWRQDAKSFLPHLIADEESDAIPPIQIGYGQEPKVSPDVLINLADEVPTFFSHFHWVFEYAYGDEDKKEKARQKFRFYRERGYPLNHKKI